MTHCPLAPVPMRVQVTGCFRRCIPAVPRRFVQVPLRHFLNRCVGAFINVPQHVRAIASLLGRPRRSSSCVSERRKRNQERRYSFKTRLRLDRWPTATLANRHQHNVAASRRLNDDHPRRPTACQRPRPWAQEPWRRPRFMCHRRPRLWQNVILQRQPRPESLGVGTLATRPRGPRLSRRGWEVSNLRLRLWRV